MAWTRGRICCACHDLIGHNRRLVNNNKAIQIIVVVVQLGIYVRTTLSLAAVHTNVRACTYTHALKL